MLGHIQNYKTICRTQPEYRGIISLCERF